MKDFAVIILSHGRAKDVKTYKSLRESGYTGKIIVLIDDMDEQKSLYERIYGDDVIIFDKKKRARITDSMINSGELRSVVFARNEANDVAKMLGYKYYAQMDDDVINFGYKCEKNGHLISRKIHRLDDVFEAIVTWMDNTKIACVGMCDPGILFGGLNGIYKDGFGRNFNQVVIIKTSSNIEFKGLTNQDINAAICSNKTGKLILELYCVTHNVVKRGADGGNSDMYKDIGMYQKRFLSIIANPDCCYLNDKGRIQICKKNAFPLILKGDIKK